MPPHTIVFPYEVHDTFVQTELPLSRKVVHAYPDPRQRMHVMTASSGADSHEDTQWVFFSVQAVSISPGKVPLSRIRKCTSFLCRTFFLTASLGT